MMSLFVILCAVMALVAIFLVVWPLVRPLPAGAKGEVVAPKAAPLAFALSVGLAIGSAVLYGAMNNYPWVDPRLAQAAPADHGGMGAGSMEEAVITRAAWASGTSEYRKASPPETISGFSAASWAPR